MAGSYQVNISLAFLDSAPQAEEARRPSLFDLDREQLEPQTIAHWDEATYSYICRTGDEVYIWTNHTKSLYDVFGSWVDTRNLQTSREVVKGKITTYEDVGIDWDEFNDLSDDPVTKWSRITPSASFCESIGVIEQTVNASNYKCAKRYMAVSGVRKTYRYDDDGLRTGTDERMEHYLVPAPACVWQVRTQRKLYVSNYMVRIIRHQEPIYHKAVMRHWNPRENRSVSVHDKAFFPCKWMTSFNATPDLADIVPFLKERLIKRPFFDVVGYIEDTTRTRWDDMKDVFNLTEIEEEVMLMPGWLFRWLFNGHESEFEGKDVDEQEAIAQNFVDYMRSAGKSYMPGTMNAITQLKRRVRLPLTWNYDTRFKPRPLIKENGEATYWTWQNVLRSCVYVPLKVVKYALVVTKNALNILIRGIKKIPTCKEEVADMLLGVAAGWRKIKTTLRPRNVAVVLNERLAKFERDVVTWREWANEHPYQAGLWFTERMLFFGFVTTWLGFVFVTTNAIVWGATWSFSEYIKEHWEWL